VELPFWGGPKLATLHILMKSSAACALIAFLPSCAPFPYVAERSPTVSGIVLDAETRQPVAGARVQPDGATHPVTKTRSDGSFELQGSKVAGFYMTGPCPKGPSYRYYNRLLVTASGYAPALRRMADMKRLSSTPEIRDAGEVLLQRPGRPLSAAEKAARDERSLAY